MPRKGGQKKKIKNKQKKQKQKQKKAQQNNNDNDENEEKQMDYSSKGNSRLLLSKKALLQKYDVRLGPEGYVPAPMGTSKSIHLEEFSMVDPGGGRELLTKTNINIRENSIYGLVGKNGFGKTTLLKLMYNYEIEGFPKHIRMVIVNQEELISNVSILSSVLKADEIREQLINEEERLGNILQGEEELSEESQDEINEILELIWGMHSDLNYDQSEKRAMQILLGLGFTKKMIKTKKVSDLSGGWQMRVKLAKALFVEPDLMLLDEPTNHLDFPTVLWLQNYLKNYKKTVIVVSHDRTFLNEVCNWTIHLTQKKLLYCRGNYDAMIRTLKFSSVEQENKYESLRMEKHKIKQWLDKYGGNSKMQHLVPSKKRLLDNIESEMELLEPPRSDKALKFQFPDVGELEECVCRMENVNFKYPNMDEIFLSNINLTLDTDSRIGMIGANGVGKSTLVKLIMGILEPIDGEYELRRNRHARIALFTQYHMDQLNLEQSAVQFLCERFANSEEMKAVRNKIAYARRRLGRFKLTGNQHTQKMKFLSGGQKSRVAFCVATWTKPHFLIMDEPTNHLDMETIDSLVEAIENFPGGVLVISHDQHFLNRAADEYWAVTPQSIKSFLQFENAKSFALKSRMQQIQSLNDDEDIIDNKKENYKKKKEAKKQQNKKHQRQKPGANKSNKPNKQNKSNKYGKKNTKKNKL